MDGFSGYNQIRMREEDKAKTSFTTLWGTFYYKVMPFDLKNGGATYRRAMVTLFHDMMHKEIEVYVDDMIGKSKCGEDHTIVLRKLLERLKKYKLRLNHAKCVFGARSGKLLGFMVSNRDIEVDPTKVQAILKLGPLSMANEVRSLLAGLNYITRFISRLSETAKPFFKLLKKNAKIKWDHECQQAFDEIKAYLSRLPVLLVTKDDPIKYFLEKPSLVGKLAKWQGHIALEEEEAEGHIPILSDNKWIMYFDGVVNLAGAGTGAVLISPDGQHYPVAAKLTFPCTNNVAEYEACILGLQSALNMKARKLRVYGESTLIILRTLGEWKTRDSKLIPYHEFLEQIIKEFEAIDFEYLPRTQNHFLDALATLASMLRVTKGIDIEPLRIGITQKPAHCMVIEEGFDDQPWYHDIKNYPTKGEFPSGSQAGDRKYIARIAGKFFLSDQILYKRSYDSVLPRCLDANEAKLLMREIHEGECGPTHEWLSLH
ncbi:uncharacterized protein LOC125316295 [Rhodamnia argentea]|uniref:Uncharacterized protein LOC125316295 n=1 Tax=Rhodamnia argentea TaxID=178133 RepID=A0ABM3HUI6_9MYRT|nr:uncharacterized protein LOC125316295 [Rhodamnia argentea]